MPKQKYLVSAVVLALSAPFSLNASALGLLAKKAASPQHHNNAAVAQHASRLKAAAKLNSNGRFAIDREKGLARAEHRHEMHSAMMMRRNSLATHHLDGFAERHAAAQHSWYNNRYVAGDRDGHHLMKDRDDWVAHNHGNQFRWDRDDHHFMRDGDDHHFMRDHDDWMARNRDHRLSWDPDNHRPDRDDWMAHNQNHQFRADRDDYHFTKAQDRDDLTARNGDHRFGGDRDDYHADRDDRHFTKYQDRDDLTARNGDHRFMKDRDDYRPDRDDHHFTKDQDRDDLTARNGDHRLRGDRDDYRADRDDYHFTKYQDRDDLTARNGDHRLSQDRDDYRPDRDDLIARHHDQQFRGDQDDQAAVNAPGHQFEHAGPPTTNINSNGRFAVDREKGVQRAELRHEMHNGAQHQPVAEQVASQGDNHVRLGSGWKHGAPPQDSNRFSGDWDNRFAGGDRFVKAGE